MSKRDYYEVLGVGRKTTDQELKSAYRKLALQCHPDRNPGDHEAEEKFKEINEAYSVLSNVESRLRYDQFGHAGVGASAATGAWADPEFGGFEDILGGFFGEIFGGGRSRRSWSQRGSDLRYDLEITLEQAASGFKTQITIPRYYDCGDCNGIGAAPGVSPISCSPCSGTGQVRFQQGRVSVSHICNHCSSTGRIIADHCKTCRGHGRIEKEHLLEIKIPAGVDTGTRLRLTGEGEAGASAGPAGDLYVVIHVKEHELFERRGNDLYVRVPITFTKAVLGGEIRVPTLNGEDALTIPEGTQTGSIFQLKRKGIASSQGYGRGDLFVVPTVVIPTRLTTEQKRLLEEFAVIEEKLSQGSAQKSGSIDHRIEKSPPCNTIDSPSQEQKSYL